MMQETGGIQVDERTRRLLLGHRLSQASEETEWEAAVRLRAEALLLQHGGLPYERLGFSEDETSHALGTDVQPKGLARLPFISRYLQTRRAEGAARARRVEEFLIGTPLRELAVPFESHTISIISVHPILERKIALERELIRSGGHLSVPQYSISDTIICFFSTAWPYRGVLRGFSFTPESFSDEAQKYGIGFYSLGLGERQKVEAVVDYTAAYVKNNRPLNKRPNVSARYKPTPGVC